MDMVFNGDLTVGVYQPTEEVPDAPILLAIRLKQATNPIAFEFTSGDPALLEGMAQTLLETAAAQRAWAPNAPFIGQSKNEVQAVGEESPNNPADAGEGVE